MSKRKASIKETGEELRPEDWERFDAAVAEERAKRPRTDPFERDASEQEPKAAERRSEAERRKR